MPARWSRLRIRLRFRQVAVRLDLSHDRIVIADDSRDIPVGAEVEFDLLCKLGRYEADHVVTI